MTFAVTLQTTIKEVFAGYAAARSGKVNAGDIIVSVDGRSLEG
jgi:C-terminal processing protease CtpA/Prc